MALDVEPHHASRRPTDPVCSAFLDCAYDADADDHRYNHHNGEGENPQSQWVTWYLHRFVGEDPFRHRAIDGKTLATVALGRGYRGAERTNLPKHIRGTESHSHIAVEDAVEQAVLFMRIVRELNAQRGDIPPIPLADEPERKQRRRRRRH